MKRIIAMIGWLLLLALVLNGLPAYAAEADPEDVEIQFTSKKEEYSEEDEIKATLTIKNNYDFAITNVYVEVIAPEGYTVENTQALPAGEKINSGKKNTTAIVLAKQVAPEETPAAPEEQEDESGSGAWIIAAAVIGIAIVAAVVILVVKKKIPHKSVISVLLVFATVGGMCAIPVQAQGNAVDRQMLSRSIELSIGGTLHTVTANVYFDSNESADDLQIDTSRLGYREDLSAFVVTGDFDGLWGTLKNAKKYSEIKLEVYDSKDNLLQKQSVPATAAWGFEEIGLFPGMNRLQITVIGETVLTVQLPLYDPYGLNYELLDGADVDSDGEGLFDLLESNLGTDEQNPDTDGDGLPDYDEVCRLGTDPLNSDSDGNGTQDGAEDYDGDQIPDGEEIRLSLSPILDDTDSDGLSDYDELNVYGTDPLKADTDEDGARDGWEAENGYRPATANETFTLSCETGAVSEATPISLEVTVTGSGTAIDVESLEITPVTVADNPFASPCIAGYMGPVMDINIEGTFETATLTFRYDTSLGTLGKNFQPRIYYFNERTKTFEELENQTVRNGVVTAQTNHFSGYTILDSAAYSAALIAGLDFFVEGLETAYDVVEGTLNRDEVLAAYSTADFAFVIDNSASMAWNDPENKCDEVVRHFIDHLRPKYDCASILKYTNAVTAQPLTSNTEKLRKALDNSRLDNGIGSTSGTNGAVALNSAINILDQGSGSNQYIVFFSDGDDAHLANGYTDIIEKAKERNIQIISVGVNAGESTYLAELANGTDGKYYNINASTPVADTFADTIALFDTLTPDLADSNNDGLSDFETKLIFDGKLPLTNNSTEFKYLDFNFDKDQQASPDWDGDGLKNGDELKVVARKGILYISMTSHPTLPDYDGDGIGDKKEVEQGTDPFEYSFDALYADDLLKDDNFIHSATLSEDYHSDLGVRLWVGAGAALSFSFSREEIYRDLYIQYLNEYGGQYQISETSSNIERDLLKTALYDTISFIHSGTSTLQPDLEFTKDFAGDLGTVHTAYSILYALNQADTLEKLGDVKDMTNKLFNYLENNKVSQGLTLNLRVKPVLLKKIEIPGKISDGLTIAVAACDVINSIRTCADVSANNVIFTGNQDILQEIYANAAADEFARAAAGNLLAMLDESYGNEILLIFKDVLFDHVSSFILEKAMTSNIYTAAVLVVIKSLDAIFGISKNIDQRFQTYAYLEFARAASRLFAPLVDTVETTYWTITVNYYEIPKSTNRDNLTRYFYHAAHAHILGERQYYRWWKPDGISSWWSDNKDILDNEKEFLKRIKMIPLALGVTLDPRLFEGS